MKTNRFAKFLVVLLFLSSAGGRFALQPEAYPQFEKAPFQKGDIEAEARTRFFLENQMWEDSIRDVEQGAWLTSAVMSAGIATYFLASSNRARSAGLFSAGAAWLGHEYLLHFVALPRHEKLMAARYMEGANWDGNPALKRKPKLYNMGVLSGTRAYMETENIFDGFFWSGIFLAHSAVFVTDVLSSSPPTDTEYVLHGTGLGFSALTASFKLLHAYYWRGVRARELRRLHAGYHIRSLGPDGNLSPIDTMINRQEGYFYLAASHRIPVSAAENNGGTF